MIHSFVRSFLLVDRISICVPASQPANPRNALRRFTSQQTAFPVTQCFKLSSCRLLLYPSGGDDGCAEACGGNIICNHRIPFRTITCTAYVGDCEYQRELIDSLGMCCRYVYMEMLTPLAGFPIAQTYPRRRMASLIPSLARSPAKGASERVPNCKRNNNTINYCHQKRMTAAEIAEAAQEEEARDRMP